MEQIIQFLNSYGLHITINQDTQPIVLFCIVILTLSLISIISCLNIVIYYIIINISDNKKVLDFLSKHPILLKVFNYYKNIRTFYIIIDFLFLFLNIAAIFALCFYVVYNVT